MRVEKAKETGLVFTDGVTLTLVSAAKASAVDRCGIGRYIVAPQCMVD